MRTLLTLGVGALAMYLLLGHATARNARRPVRTELEPDRPSETPPGAQHLGR